jgi:hypothetical protein
MATRQDMTVTCQHSYGKNTNNFKWHANSAEERFRNVRLLPTAIQRVGSTVRNITARLTGVFKNIAYEKEAKCEDISCTYKTYGTEISVYDASHVVCDHN